MSSVEWETPQDFFDTLNQEFRFTLDVCAMTETAKCKRYFTPSTSGLAQSWAGEVCWCNPPYGRGLPQTPWVVKAYNEARYCGATVVLLLPASTDTKIWHDFCMRAAEIRFIKDRLHFQLNDRTARANHGNVVVVFRPGYQGPPRTSSIDTKGNQLGE